MNTDQTTEMMARSNLTRSQFLIWMGQKLTPDVPLYNMVLTFTINGDIDPGAFQEAFQTVIDQSDALRTVIEEKDNVPQRTVRTRVPYQMACLDFSREADAQATFETWLDQHRTFSFNLEGVLFDTALVKLADNWFVWYLNQHHLITDGWSVALVYQRMATCYRLVMENRLAETPEWPAFEAYPVYEQQVQQTTAGQHAKKLWQQKTMPPNTSLSCYAQPVLPQTTRSSRLVCDLGITRTTRLNAIAKEKGVRAITPDLTRFNMFSTLLFSYLHLISDRQEWAIGALAHNRVNKAFKDTIGVFIELFPLQADIAPDETFATLLGKVARETNQFIRHAQPGTGNAEADRACHAVLNYITASFPDFNGLPMRSQWVHPGHMDSHHALRLHVHDFDATGSWTLLFDFNEAVFSSEQQPWAVKHFLRLIDAFIENRTQPLAQVSMLSEEERQQAVVAYNQTERPYPRDETIVQQFEHQVARTPDDVAIVCGAQTWTYRAFNARANQLAHYLRKHGVKPEIVVGICMNRSINMVVAIYGVLKAGGAYLPVDPEYPAERMQFMLQETQATLLLTQSYLTGRLPEYSGEVIRLDTDWSVIAGDDTGNPMVDMDPGNLAYIIYTSGSTGQPKGALLTHRNLVNYIYWAQAQYLRGEALDFPLYSSFAFDLTVTSLFTPLISGGCLVIYNEDQHKGDLTILQVIKDDAVDIVKLTPSHLSLIKTVDIKNTRIRKFIVGGEDFKTDLARDIMRLFGDAVEIYNEYGPTETTVGCMIHRFNPEKDRMPSVPIGIPAANAQIYILNDALTPVPTGIIGEMYIGGDGVARGYLNRPELTSERFIPNPFRPGERLYRTGDLARWRSPGDMEFLGRMDHQVKIHGARIELGEIEAALLAHADISDCVVEVVRHTPDEVIGETAGYCTKCGLPAAHPDADLDINGLCSLCLAFDQYQDKAMRYFKSMADLAHTLHDIKASRTGAYDCLMLLSGGKDSTYALYQLVEMGLKVLVFSLDNGYISEGAKANIRRAVDDLGLELIWGQTPAMPAFFSDSLKQHSNVCNGCFKTIYTLSMNLAREHGISCIVTGLSRGQIFETRLDDLFRHRIFDIDTIDQMILDARKAYHRMDDVIARSLDVTLFKEDSVFEEIQFIDFYRYCDASLEDILSFLNEKAPWIRPKDTGRSTNCLINEAGIFVHKKERGYHNYALPYSWDVRLGHKTREAALEELDDRIDPDRVRSILQDINYPMPQADQKNKPGESRLAAYYVSSKDQTTSDLRTHLGRTLPDYMMPAHFIRLAALPLTTNGKIDRHALPRPEEKRPALATDYIAPMSHEENILAEIWAAMLKLEQVGRYDNFFELGGDSMINIQIVARAQEAGLHLTPKQLFDHPTVAELAAVVSYAPKQNAEQGTVTGAVELTPIQHWFFDQTRPSFHHWNQSLLLHTSDRIDLFCLKGAVQDILSHHDALRLRFVKEESGWKAALQTDATAPAEAVLSVDLTDLPEAEQAARMEEITSEMQASLNLAHGPLLRVTYFDLGAARPARLLMNIHHLVVDSLSWPILLEDLEAAYRSRLQQKPVTLPPKTTAFKHWSKQLTPYAQSDMLRRELGYWCDAEKTPAPPLPVDHEPVKNTEASAQTISVLLSANNTQALRLDTSTAYHTQINDLLLAALLQTFSGWTGSAALRLDIEKHGRETIDEATDLSRTVGWFTALFPITLQLPDEAGTGAILVSVKEQFRQIPNGGIGYGVLRYLHERDTIRERLKTLPKAELLFNYMGQLDQSSGRPSLFQPADPLRLSHDAQGERRYLLEINVCILNGQLRMDWTYNENLHQQATVHRLANRYVETLQVLIAHCTSTKPGGHTPSDFPLARLNDQKLKQLAGALNRSDHARKGSS